MSPSDRADTVMLTILPARRHHTVGANCILSDVSHSSRHAWMHRCMHACVLVRRADAQRSTSALERLAHRHVLTHRPQALQVCLHSTASVGSLQCHARQGRSSHEQHSCRTCASSQLAPEGTMRPTVPKSVFGKWHSMRFEAFLRRTHLRVDAHALAQEAADLREKGIEPSVPKPECVPIGKYSHMHQPGEYSHVHQPG